MKAAVCRRYGPPENVVIQDLPEPTVGPRDVLVQVKASTVSSGDNRIRGRKFPRGFDVLARLALGWKGPRRNILGTELSGVVKAVGREVTRFKVGDAVIAYPGIKLGAHAEVCLVSEDGALIKKPDSLTFEQAAALGFGGLTALYFLRDRVKLKAGDSVLVIGASGAVGVAMVQLARYWGATVTAVCSGRNAELVRGLGANRVVDYTREDFRQQTERYDVVCDTTGTVSAPSVVDLVKPQGKIVLASADLSQMLEPLWKSLKDGRSVITGTASERAADLQLLSDLASQGHYQSVIDCSFPLDHIAKAYAYVDTGRKRGSVLVTMI